MSEYTPEEILKMIEDNGGPEGLDLSGKDLRGIALSINWIEEEMGRRGLTYDNPPPWFSQASDGINLEGVNLQDARLQGTNLESAGLPDANLRDAYVDAANLEGAFLWGADLAGARLVKANLQGALLTEANLQRAWLSEANLQGAFLWEANLQGALLRKANLQGASFERANLQGALLRKANLKGAYITADCFGQGVGEELNKRWELAREMYLALKTNFLSLGQYDDARWAFVKERRMERHARCPWREATATPWGKAPPVGKGLHSRAWRWLQNRAAECGRGLRHPRASLKWLWSWFLDVFAEYFTNPWRVLLELLFLALVAFPLAYASLNSTGWGGVERVLTDGTRVAPSIGDYLIFSLRTLPTLAFTDLQPVGAGRWVSAVEGGLGVGLLALFIYTLGRRVAGY